MAAYIETLKMLNVIICERVLAVFYLAFLRRKIQSKFTAVFYIFNFKFSIL